MQKENKPVFCWKKLAPVFWIYLFILGLELLKKTSLSLAPNLTNILSSAINTNPIKALSAGWLLTSIFQSSGAIDSLSLTLMANSIISLRAVIFIIMGATIGTTITALIISLLTKAKKRDFRHGFEIGTSATIYNVLIIAIFFILEITFKELSSITQVINSFIHTPKIGFIPDLVSFITSPVINPLSKISFKPLVLLIAFLLLLVSLRFLSKSVVQAIGGEKQTKEIIRKYFSSKTKSFFIGIGITAIVFSSSITIGLLVPLTMSRLITLKKAIPFILGAEIGTMTDVLLASIIIGKSITLSLALMYLIMLIIGALIFLPNTSIIFNLTKYVSKHLLNISRKRAVLYLITFITIPLIILLI
ncbi:MAG: hypothetical protein KKG60_02460 [Nanoarchaeota archaeon]|nr:hypothetical protein [Nanoarchaeota archaeon]